MEREKERREKRDRERWKEERKMRERDIGNGRKEGDKDR